MPCRREVALQVDVDHGVPLGLVHVHEHPVAQDPRVVDEDVEAAELVDRVLDHPLGAREVRHVLGSAAASPPSARISSATCSAGRRVRALAAERAAEVVDQHLRPARASARACSRPIPRPAPVTIATFPRDPASEGSLDSRAVTEGRHPWPAPWGAAARTARLDDPRLPQRRLGAGPRGDRVGRAGGVLLPLRRRLPGPRRHGRDAPRHGDGGRLLDADGGARALPHRQPQRRLLPLGPTGAASRGRAGRAPDARLVFCEAELTDGDGKAIAASRCTQVVLA